MEVYKGQNQEREYSIQWKERWKRYSTNTKIQIEFRNHLKSSSIRDVAERRDGEGEGEEEGDEREREKGGREDTASYTRASSADIFTWSK